MKLQGQRVLITGAARGIGRAIAERFLQEGAKVFLIDKQQGTLETTAAELGLSYSDVAYAICDLTDMQQIELAANQAWEQWGGLDILINNAGIAVREPFLEISQLAWKTILGVNLDAMFYLSQIICRMMKDNSIQGSVVNMSSKNGIAGSSSLAHYNASKGGVILLTQSMAVELAQYGIRVNAVAPGFIDTPLDRELKAKETQIIDVTLKTPMRRLGTPAEVANVFLFLASNEASYITGTTLVVDGGHLANASEF